MEKKFGPENWQTWRCKEKVTELLLKTGKIDEALSSVRDHYRRVELKEGYASN